MSAGHHKLAWALFCWHCFTSSSSFPFLWSSRVSVPPPIHLVFTNTRGTWRKGHQTLKQSISPFKLHFEYSTFSVVFIVNAPGNLSHTRNLALIHGCDLQNHTLVYHNNIYDRTYLYMVKVLLFNQFHYSHKESFRVSTVRSSPI